MLTGVILAGGRSSRMGSNKALLPFFGETILERQIREMDSACSRLMLITNQPLDYQALIPGHVEVFEDRFPGHGPLCGLEAALSRCQDPAWVVGCDVPFLSASAACLMADLLNQEDRDAVIPVIQGVPQMLHGIYHPRCHSVIERLLKQQQYRLMGLLDQIHYRTISEDEFWKHGVTMDFSFDMDTPDDYRNGMNGPFPLNRKSFDDSQSGANSL